MSILNITEKPEIDISIEKYEYHSYEPIAGNNLNNPSEMRINIKTQVLFAHPAESYLLFDSKLVKAADEAEYANADIISLTNCDEPRGTQSSLLGFILLKTAA